MPVQAVLITRPGAGKQRFAQLYWGGVRRILGLKVTIIGDITEHRPVIFIANHCSWIDIVALGSVLPGCFVSKAAVAEWPFIKWIAILGRTIFVSRNRATVRTEQNQLSQRLVNGDNIILFPEGTTSDGSRILPFSSTFLAIAQDASKPWVQLITLVYDELEGLPVQRWDRPNISWYGDMDLASHVNRIGRRSSLHATLIVDQAIAPDSFPGRKQLSLALETRLAHNAAALRQRRD